VNHIIDVYTTVGNDIAVRCSCGNLARLVAVSMISLDELSAIADEHIRKAEAA